MHMHCTESVIYIDPQTPKFWEKVDLKSNYDVSIEICIGQTMQISLKISGTRLYTFQKIIWVSNAGFVLI